MATAQQTLSDAPRDFSKPPEGKTYRENYEDYIRSKRWERRRVAYFAKFPRACRACGSKTQIHLHHHTYKRMGNEMDEDLVPLCEGCHTLCHQYHRANSGMSLTRATGEFLKLHGAVLRPKPVKATKKRRRAAMLKCPQGSVPREEAERLLGLRKDQLPAGRPKKRAKNGKGAFVPLVVINQWLANPPAWLVLVRQASAPATTTQRPTAPQAQRPAPPITHQIGDRVVLVATSSTLTWARNKHGTIREIISTSSWMVELDDSPGSRMAVTAQMVAPLVDL